MTIDAGTVGSRKKNQQKEGRARHESAPRVSAEDRARANQENIEAAEVDNDDAVVGDEQTDQVPVREPAGQEDDTPAPRERQLAPGERRRAEIVANHRTNRSEQDADADENADDIKRLTNDGMPPELVAAAEDTEAEAEEDEPVAEADAGAADTAEEPEPEAEAAADEPKKRKVVVRGQEMWVTDDELLAAAQKGLAGDDYLNEARTTLDEVKSLRKDMARPGQPGKHPAGEQGEAADDSASENLEHPEITTKTVVDTLQFGEPDEAARLLDDLIDKRVNERTKSLTTTDRLNAELNRSNSLLAQFAAENADLRDDRNATAVITSNLFALQAEDLGKAGIDITQFRGSPDQVNNQIANAHLRLRADGRPVRTIPALLERAKEDYTSWRGGSTAPKPNSKPAEVKVDQQQHQQQVPPKTNQPATPVTRDASGRRVEVNLDRTARRAAITPTPSRTVSPKPNAAATPAAPRDRSAVVQNMVAMRQRPRVPATR